MTTRITADNITDGTIQTADLSANVTAAYATGLVPKITTVNVANSTYAVLDDTAVNIGGGYLVITGKNFESGAQVLVDITPATSTTFVNTTTLRAEVPTKSAATYNLYVVNPDGGTGTKVNGLTYSGIPTWVTGSTLANVTSNQAFTGSLSATGATSYANTTALPAGFNLVTANGYYYGNISVGSATTYNFTISAIDAELQDSPRTFSLTAVTVTPPTSVEYLVVAGGAAGGGGLRGGGGGAGGYRTSVPGQTSGRGSSAEATLSVTAGTTYTITVGGGGSSVSSGRGTAGSNSVFSTITSIGGGGGGAESDPGGNGGSGGGRGQNAGPGTRSSGTTGQGYDGGRGLDAGGDNEGGGGGGGAGAQGADRASLAGAAGGNGLSSPISGSSVTRGGGGGGGSNGFPFQTVPGGLGGSGGGGNGATGPSPAATSGTVNTGGGGGGAGYTGAPSSGAGGSGIVIIRYADTFSLASNTTGSPTITTSGGYRIYTFTGSGSITF